MFCLCIFEYLYFMEELNELKKNVGEKLKEVKEIKKTNEMEKLKIKVE